jgi:hypothetical protein
MRAYGRRAAGATVWRSAQAAAEISKALHRVGGQDRVGHPSVRTNTGFVRGNGSTSRASMKLQWWRIAAVVGFGGPVELKRRDERLQLILRQSP